MSTTAVSGVIQDLCHVLGVDLKRVLKIEILPRHVEVWFTDTQDNPTLKTVMWR